MEANNNNIIVSTRFVCNHFYRVYRNKDKPNGVTSLFKDFEVIFVCQKCHEFLAQYMDPNNLEFFSEIIKMLIKHFIPQHESNCYMTVIFFFILVLI